MSSAKKALLAGASLLLAAGLAYSVQPSFAEGADAEDFMQLQENLSGGVQSEQPAVDPAVEADAPADTPTQVDETVTEADPSADNDGAVAINPNDPDFLGKISGLQKAITLKTLELQLQQKTSELDRLTGAAEAREAALEATRAGGTGAPAGAAPIDDTATLPVVAAIVGAKGKIQAELSLNGGGIITAKAGDMLPGGWQLARIEGSAVYVKSARSGTEYVLGSASAPAAQTSPAAIAAPAPAAQPAQDAGAASGDSDIILAPAN